MFRLMKSANYFLIPIFKLIIRLHHYNGDFLGIYNQCRINYTAPHRILKYLRSPGMKGLHLPARSFAIYNSYKYRLHTLSSSSLCTSINKNFTHEWSYRIWGWERRGGWASFLALNTCCPCLAQHHPMMKQQVFTTVHTTCSSNTHIAYHRWTHSLKNSY